MDLSIIIVNWNCGTYTRECVVSILSTTQGLEYEIIVVDNASTDNSREILNGEFERTRILLGAENVGFARANNLACQVATGRNVLFLNPDTRVIGEAIPLMMAALESSTSIGAVGCRLLNGDLSLQTSCVQRFPTIFNQITDIDWLKRCFPSLGCWGIGPLSRRLNGTLVDVEAVSGACLMMKRPVFDQIGWFSTDYFLYTEDVDLCYKVHQADLRVCHVGRAHIVHYGGRSSGIVADGFADVLKCESIRRFLRKTRGGRYADAYRRVIGASAMLRILLLQSAAMWPFWRTSVLSSLSKWRKILRWSRGQERWAEQLGAQQPRAGGR